MCGKPYVNLWKKKSGQKLFIFFIDENNQSAYNRDDVLLLINQGKIIDKGGAYQWKWHSSLKKDPEQKFTDSELVWAQKGAARFWLQED